jgi:hypothetical protein
MDRYATAEAVFADADAKIELAKALRAKVQQPITGTPAERFLVQTRKIPPEAVAGCASLGYLPSPLEGRHPTDHALVSLLLDSSGEATGLQLEYCDISGARTATEPFKQTYSLRANGCRDGLFHAGGGPGDTAYLTEGYSCKALAVASLGLGPAVGSGGLGIIGLAPPPERKVVLVPDAAPAPDKWTAEARSGCWISTRRPTPVRSTA